MSSSNAHIRKPKPLITRKAQEADDSYLDRYMAALYKRDAKAVRRNG